MTIHTVELSQSREEFSASLPVKMLTFPARVDPGWNPIRAGWRSYR